MTLPPADRPQPHPTDPVRPDGRGYDRTTADDALALAATTAGPLDESLDMPLDPVRLGTGPPRALVILLVDDSEDDLVLLTEAFRELPQVQLLPPARDGQSALARLRSCGGAGDSVAAGERLSLRPDLMLIDVNLPGLNGFEVVVAIRGEPALQTLPVVLLSTSSLDTDVQRAYRCGANSYITKPASFDTLRETARSLVTYWSETVRIPQG